MPDFFHAWLLATWCELRNELRSFQLGWISDRNIIDEGFASEPGQALRGFLNCQWPWQRGAAKNRVTKF